MNNEFMIMNLNMNSYHDLKCCVDFYCSSLPFSLQIRT